MNRRCHDMQDYSTILDRLDEAVLHIEAEPSGGSAWQGGRSEGLNPGSSLHFQTTMHDASVQQAAALKPHAHACP